MHYKQEWYTEVPMGLAGIVRGTLRAAQ